MHSRPSVFTKIWRKIRGKARPKVAREMLRKEMPSLEPLESRIAPATLINPSTVIFQDLDGDIVTVKFSKPLFDAATDPAKLAAASAVLKFNTGSVDLVAKTFTPVPNGAGQQLQLIDLLAARTVNGVSIATGTTVAVSVAKGTSGDGFTDVGYIHAYEAAGGNSAARGVALGAVSIAGDLGQIDAGDLYNKVGVASLNVHSLGVADATTKQPAVAAQLTSSRTVVSNVYGSIGSLTVAEDVKGTIRAENGNSFNDSRLNVYGTIGNVTVGGSLRGGAAIDSGSIISATNIGAVKIGTAIDEGIFGGAGGASGTIRAGGSLAGKITSLTVSGSIVGGAGAGSAVVSSKTTIGAVKIGGDLDARSAGSAVGVAGVDARGAITSLTVGGTIFGGGNSLDGYVTAGADLGAVKVKAITGNAGTNSASISAGGKIASLTVTDSITASTGVGSASIASGTDLDLLGDMGAIKIGGKLIGGVTQNSGSISCGGKIASITIGPAVAVDQVVLQGNSGLNSGTIFSQGAIGAVKVTGSIDGGSGVQSGSIVSRDNLAGGVERAGSIGAVTISGHVKGGSGDDSGQIKADGHITSIALGTTTIDGDLIAGGGSRSGNLRAGQGIVESGLVGAITIKGDILNTVAAGQGGGIFSEGKITSVSVSKTINGGTIRAGDNIGAIVVTGDVSNAKISARGLIKQGATSDLAIGKITINGSVAGTTIRAGYDTSLITAVNPDAQIGAVAVKGSWTASDLIAGVVDGGAAGFGTTGDQKSSGPDNAKIISSIASIVIGGAVTGTSSGGDHFGFVAQKLGSIKIAGVAVTLPGTVGVPFDLATLTTGDVSALIVA